MDLHLQSVRQAPIERVDTGSDGRVIRQRYGVPTKAARERFGPLYPAHKIFSMLLGRLCRSVHWGHRARSTLSSRYATATEEFGVPPPLRETIADMRFGQGDVATADRTIAVHILAEVGVGDRLANLGFYVHNVG